MMVVGGEMVLIASASLILTIDPPPSSVDVAFPAGGRRSTTAVGALRFPANGRAPASFDRKVGERGRNAWLFVSLE